MLKVAVTPSSFGVDDGSPLRVLADAGYEVVLNPHGRQLDIAETLQLVDGCVGVVAGTERYDRNVLEALPGLRVISRLGVGIDAIDLGAAGELGVRVCNTPDGPTRGVAELTLALALDMLRKVSQMDRELRSGTWKKRNGNLLLGKRVAVVGMGRIGREVAALMSAVGAEVAYTDVVEDVGVPHACMALPDLLAWADIVTLHCSAQECGPLIGASEIAAMKRGSWLVNIARGGIVDEDALVAALADGHLAGAALDVFSSEPYSGPLTAFDNVVLTPHVGSYARECRIAMEADAVQNLLRELAESAKVDAQ